MQTACRAIRKCRRRQRSACSTRLRCVRTYNTVRLLSLSTEVVCAVTDRVIVPAATATGSLCTGEGGVFREGLMQCGKAADRRCGRENRESRGRDSRRCSVFDALQKIKRCFVISIRELLCIREDDVGQPKDVIIQRHL